MYRDLEVWQKAIDLVVATYEITKSFPEVERFGLTNQLRRDAVSIPSNIAEGLGRQSQKEFLKFLQMARGSLMEGQTQIEIAVRINYLFEKDSEPPKNLVSPSPNYSTGSSAHLSFVPKSPLTPLTDKERSP